MKTITAIALLLVSIKAAFAQLAAPSIGNGELLVAFSYNADTNRYKITYSFKTDIIYDAYFNPKKVVPDQESGDYIFMRFGAIWDEVYGENGGVNGVFYYAKYKITFWDIGQAPRKILAQKEIDFRDGDYYHSSLLYAAPGGSTPQLDFYIFYENGQAVTRYPNSSSPASPYVGIWQIRGKSQNSTAFKNFNFSTQGFIESLSYAVNVNGSNYSFSGNGSRGIGVGLTNPVTATVRLPNRIPVSNSEYSYYLISWNGANMYDSTYSLTFDGENDTSNVTASYVRTNMRCSIVGPSCFGNSNPVLFLAEPYGLRNPEDMEFRWFIKYDATGTWQEIPGSWYIQIASPYTPNHGYDLKCWMKDKVLKIGLWSENKRVNYGTPLTASIIGPTSCITQFSTVTWYADPSGGCDNYTYQWKKDNTVVGTGPSVSLQVTGGFRLHLTVTSTYGSQTYTTYKDISTSGCGGGGGGGCPFVFIHTELGLVQDNNILNKSEFDENVGTDIVDRYRLNTKPHLDNGQYKLSIQELNDDHSYFDAFRLYAVDHPEGTDIGIAEDNDIVLLYPSYVESASDARMRGQDLTGAIAFKEAFGLRGEKSDTLRLRFSHDSQRWNNLNTLRVGRRESVALVAETEDVTINALPKEPFAAVSTEESSYSLSGRESSSRLILPIGSIPDDLSIVWNRDYTVKDIGLTRVFYDGFVQRELSLAEAIHSQKGKIRKDLSEPDGKYGELLPGETITLTFNNSAPLRQGYVRDFVLETTGRYVVPGSESRAFFKKEESKLFVPTKFGLVGNYPNPFNPTTTIVYDIADQSDVKLSIFNSLGQLVREFNEGVRSQGRYTLMWDGKNSDGKQVPSGVYIYQLTAGQFVQTKKMLLVK